MTPYDSSKNAVRLHDAQGNPDTLTRFGAESHAFADLTQFVIRAIGAVGIWYKTRALARQLNEMDDRMLADIGMQRYQINDFIAGRFPGTATKPAAIHAPATDHRHDDDLPLAA